VSPLPERFGGIVPPVCTPFTESYEVDVASLRRLIAFLLDAGVHGLFVLGSTSETAVLTDAQRATVIETAVAAAGGQVPVLAGIIDLSTVRAIEHAKVAQRLRADALVATAPFYIRPSQAEIVAHFREIRAAVDLPLFAYDVPPNVHVKLERATLAELARERTIVGMKDSSGDEANFRGVLLATRDVPGFAAFSGTELLVDVALLMGAAGAVPGMANVDPAGYVRLYDAMRRGDLDTARREQERLYRLFAIIAQASPGTAGFTGAALGGFKTALHLRGVIATNVTGFPMRRLDEAATQRIRGLLAEGGLM